MWQSAEMFCRTSRKHVFCGDQFECFHIHSFLYVFMSISVSMCRFILCGDIGNYMLFSSIRVCVFVHVCCWGTSDLRAHCTPRLLAGGLSALGGQADLIFHRSTAHPWTPSLSPHGWPESCSVNTRLKYAACQPPFHHVACSLAGPHN